MREERPNPGRRVRSADAAVFKAVEHEAELERQAQAAERERLARQQAQQQRARQQAQQVQETPFVQQQQQSPFVQQPSHQFVQQPARRAPSQTEPARYAALTRNPQTAGRPAPQGRQQPTAQAHLTRGPQQVNRPQPETRPEPQAKRRPKPQKQPKVKQQKARTRTEAPAEPHAKKRITTTVLLFVLFFVVIFGAIFAGAVHIYQEDTSLIVSEHTIEAGQSANLGMYITGKPFMEEYVSCNLDFTTVNYTLPQTIRFTITMYGTNFPCVLNIIDTTAPTGEGIPQTLYSVDEIPPVEECITNVSDLNAVSVEWAELPDISAGGSFVAIASVKDSSGNETLVEVPLSVTRDTVAPVISGTEDIESYIGDTIRYRENVTVTDDIDPHPVLDIDTSEAIMDEPGTYVITYRATDFTGNTSETTINLTLKKKPSTYVEPELVYEEAQKILDSITTDDMSDMEVALQITYWVRYNVYYVSYCDDSSWTRAAYDGFTKRNGNCYTFAMCAKALFDVAGIENMIIIRDPYIYNPHYWNYIKIDGQWYHCDSTPRIGWSSYFFMYTTAELKSFWHNGWNGYNFPEELYPESATESVQDRINYSGHSLKY